MELFEYEKKHAEYVRKHLGECVVLLKNNGAKVISLGNRILRTETAAIVSAGVIMQILETF